METGGTDMDYVSFSPEPYRTNNTNAGTGAAGAPASADAQSVILYMPNSTPTVGNANAWSEMTFTGPLGQLQKDTSALVGEAASQFGGGASISAIGQRFTDNLQNGGTAALKNAKAAGGQLGMKMLGGFLGTTPNQMLALGSGNVYNPNVELLYSAPQMRSFAFNFDMTPKNPTEAQMVNRIILNFKKWAAPLDLENGMFEIPYVWQIQYKTGTQTNKNMNQFKKAALSSVSVVANQQTEMHVAHSGGVPITTSIQLSFQEVDIIVRQDHERVGGQGY